jgi:hypothetical protein
MAGLRPIAKDRPIAYRTPKIDGGQTAIKNERHIMHLLLLSPVLASGIWIGGGAVGLILVVLIVVLLVR